MARKTRRGKRGGRGGGSATTDLRGVTPEAVTSAMVLSRMFPEDDPTQILATCLSIENPKVLIDKFADPFTSAGVGNAPYISNRNTSRHTETVLLDAWAKSPWLRAVVGRIANAVASTTWRTYAIRKNGRYVRNRTLQESPSDTHFNQIRSARQAGELIEIYDHPINSLLSGEGTMFVGLTLRQLTQVYIDITGEAFWILNKNQFGVPYQALPVPPHWVTSPTSTTNPTYTVKVGASTFNVPASNILRFHDPDPLDPFGRGVGIATAVADNLDIDLFSSKHISSHFLNRARPDIVVSADGLSPQSTSRLEHKWMQTAQGFMRAYAPLFLNRKVDIKELSQTFESMELTDLRHSSRDAVQQVYGIPPEMIGVVESANRSTINASETLFSRWTVLPRLEFLRQHLQAFLVPQYDERLVITYDNPVNKDNEFHLQAANAMPDTMTFDEWREKQGLDPVGGELGRSYFMSNRRRLKADPLEPDDKNLAPTPDRKIRKEDLESIIIDEVSAAFASAKVEK